MQLRASSEKMVINRQTMLKTNKGDFRVSEKDVTLKPGARMKFINNWSLVDEICPEDNCHKKAIDINVTIETKARTPFFLSRPEFSVGFYMAASQSWVDAIITAARSEQKSITSVNCLRYYNVYESIFKTSNLFNKTVPGTTRMDSILVYLNQSERKRPVAIRIKILTKSQLLKTKPNTTIHLEWTSVVILSRDISKKIIGLPGNLRSVTMETLSFVQNYTINLYWIPDLFNRNFYQPENGRFCHKDVTAKTKYTYCLNYTSVQNSYLFFWHFTQYLQCYVTAPPWLIRHAELYWVKRGFKIPKNNTCPKEQSEKNITKSWTEASNLCKSIGATLPLLRNRDELEEIIAFLKLSVDMPPVEGLYIGLKRSFKSQVTMR